MNVFKKHDQRTLKNDCPRNQLQVGYKICFNVFRMLQTKTWRLLLKLWLEDYYQRCHLTAPKMLIECSRGYLKNLSKLCPPYCYKGLTNGPTNLLLADSNNLQVCTTNTFEKGHCLVVCTFLEIQSLIGTELHWAFNSELSQVTENSTKDCPTVLNLNFTTVAAIQTLF